MPVVQIAGAPLARPRVAALDYGNTDLSEARRKALARFGFVIMGWTRTSLANPDRLAFIDALRAARPGIRLANYSILVDAFAPQGPSDDHYPWFLELEAMRWWAYSAPSGARTRWSSAYNAYQVNLQDRRTNPAGLTLAQAKARFDWTYYMQPAGSRIDELFVDNFFVRYRAAADFNCDGVDEPYMPNINAPHNVACRLGHAEYLDALKALRPDLKFTGNVDTDTTNEYRATSASPEIRGRLHRAFLEGVLGRKSSLDTWIGSTSTSSAWFESTGAGFPAVLKWVRSAIESTVDKCAFFSVYADLDRELGLRLARYGLTAALLDDATFVLMRDQTSGPPQWMDEFDAPIGSAIDPPAAAPWQCGVYLRRYANGAVLCNPTNADQTVTLPAGYRLGRGTQDPTANTGATLAAGPFKVPAKDGRVLLKATTA